MSGLIVPEPGWIAARLMPYGSRMGLALLGVVTTLEDGKAGDDDINTFFATLADSDDSVFDLNQYYIALEASYPFLVGHLGALTAWTEQPSMADYDKVRRAAEALATVAWSEVESNETMFVMGRAYRSGAAGAGGDILGRVYSQMLSIGAGRTTVFDYASINDAYVGMIERGAFLQPHNSFIDAWCGSGCRVIALHQILLDFGHPTDIQWRLNDPNAVAVALAGMNMVGYGIGPDVKLSNNREWAEQWASSSLWALTPAVRASLPPELSLDTPIPADQLGQEVLPSGESPFQLP